MSTKKTQSDVQHLQSIKEDLMTYVGLAQQLDSNGRNDIFPAQYYARSELERRKALIKDYTKHLKADVFKRDDGTPINNIKVEYVPTQEDIDIEIQNDNSDQLVAYEQWLTMKFHPSNPSHAKLIKKLYPGYYEKRREQAKKMFLLQNRIASIKLMGAETIDDWEFLYLAEVLNIPIDKSAIHVTGDIYNTHTADMYTGNTSIRTSEDNGWFYKEGINIPQFGIREPTPKQTNRGLNTWNWWDRRGLAAGVAQAPRQQPVAPYNPFQALFNAGGQ